MLAGVGGRTIAEAKERLSYPEALAWFAYRKQHGPLNLGIKLEWLLAQLAYVVAASSGAKGKGKRELSMADFLMFESKPEEDDEQLTLETLARMFGAKK